jgi:hypothetical protein
MRESISATKMLEFPRVANIAWICLLTLIAGPKTIFSIVTSRMELVLPRSSAKTNSLLTRRETKMRRMRMLSNSSLVLDLKVCHRTRTTVTYSIEEIREA